MTDRLLIAYLLMTLLTAGFAAVIWWNIHHSPKRTHERARKKDQLRDQRSQAERESK